MKEQLEKAVEIIKSFMLPQSRRSRGDYNRQGYCETCSRDPYFAIEEGITQEAIRKLFEEGVCPYPSCPRTVAREFLNTLEEATCDTLSES